MGERQTQREREGARRDREGKRDRPREGREIERGRDTLKSVCVRERRDKVGRNRLRD